MTQRRSLAGAAANPQRQVVLGQRVRPEKATRARELRREMTEAEYILWHALRRAGLTGMKFRRQQVIDGFIVDFYCHRAGLVVEVDGSVHDSVDQAGYDAERDAIIAGRGLRVIRFSNDDVLTNLSSVLSRIANAATAPT